VICWGSRGRPCIAAAIQSRGSKGLPVHGRIIRRNCRRKKRSQSSNAEPGKCSKIDWFDLADLPEEIVTYVRTGIQAHRRGETFSLDSWLRAESSRHR
jgi:hypothetical protein